jgi:ABC-type antimicrobial peptide transport system permease subunit
MAFTSIPIALSSVALLAIWMAALRASRLDPIQALRYE